MSEQRLIVFRSRLREGVEAVFGKDADHIFELAKAMPGFVSSTDFTSEDGERLALVEFASAKDLAGWRDEPRHRSAQQRGRDHYYAQYSLQICDVVREARFAGGDADAVRTGADPAVHRAIAERWLDCFARKDLDGLLALYADDAHHTSPKIRTRHPETGGAIRGKPALRAWWADAFARLPDLEYRPTCLVADASRVVMEYVRHVPGEPDMPIAETLDIRGGVIVASRVFHG